LRKARAQLTAGSRGKHRAGPAARNGDQAAVTQIAQNAAQHALVVAMKALNQRRKLDARGSGHELVNGLPQRIAMISDALFGAPDLAQVRARSHPEHVRGHAPADLHRVELAREPVEKPVGSLAEWHARAVTRGDGSNQGRRLTQQGPGQRLKAHGLETILARRPDVASLGRLTANDAASFRGLLPLASGESRAISPRPMSDDEADLAAGTLVAGKLRIVRALGVGGMGAVYEVEHQLTRHRRALKLLHPQFAGNSQAVARFLREASAAGRIGNEHIVETFDAGVLDSGEPYLVMELLQGRSLAALVEDTGRISERDAIEWLAQACDGLQAAHDAGIVHRDIKPDNLFITGSGRVKILDFGISKFDPVLTGERQLTGELTLGTPYYMAPEQTSKSSGVDHRADVYAVGVVLYECVTGTRPFQAETYPELIVRIHLGDYPAASSISPTAALLDVVIARAMARRPDDRFQTPSQLAKALRDLLPETERARAAFDTTRRAGDLTALLEEHKRAKAAGGLERTEHALERAPIAGAAAPTPATRVEGTSNPPRASTPPSGYEATLLSARSDAPPATRRSRAWIWVGALGVVVVVAAALWSQVQRSTLETSAAAAAVEGAATATAVPTVAPASIATSAPAASFAASVPATALHHPTAPVSSAKPASSSTRAGQHGLEQENPFK
jgi:eukaryotic-like serine/threonine-protein kinase